MYCIATNVTNFVFIFKYQLHPPSILVMMPSETRDFAPSALNRF